MDITADIFANSLTVEDLIYLNQLLETELPLSSCMELLRNRKNEKIFEKISKQLNEGKMIEEIIGDYLPKQIRNYMLPLLNSFSFNKSLSLSLGFYNRQNDSSNLLLSSITYPCILLFVTVSALYLFDLYGIDAIFELLRSFGDQLAIYESVRVLFRILIRLFYYGMLIIVALLAYYLHPKRITLLYLFVSKHFPSSLFSIYYSEQFVSLLLICISRGYGSKQSVEILKKMKNKPIISLLAFHLDEALLEGQMMKDAVKKEYYDFSLSRFIKIANYSNDFEGVLNSYTKLARQRIDQRMKNYSKTIQFFTYLIIGLIIVFVYQILFLPMQAISAL